MEAPSVLRASWRNFTIAIAGIFLLLAISAAQAMQVTAGKAGEAPTSIFGLAKVFIFLFVTIGPFNVLTPFSSMTQGRNNAVLQVALGVEFVVVALRLLGMAKPWPP